MQENSRVTNFTFDNLITIELKAAAMLEIK